MEQVSQGNEDLVKMFVTYCTLHHAKRKTLMTSQIPWIFVNQKYVIAFKPS